MVKVMKGINDNKIIIVFMIAILFMALCTGLQERNNSNNTNNQIIVAK